MEFSRHPHETAPKTHLNWDFSMPLKHSNGKHGIARERSLRSRLGRTLRRDRKRFTRRRRFVAEQLEARLLLAADLTVITHGRMGSDFRRSRCGS